MISEIASLIQSVTALGDIVKANRSLGNFNQEASTLYEINAKLLTVQSAAFAAHEEKVALAQRVRDLEKEIMELKNWNRERERYQLTEIAPRTHVYRIKPGMEAGEPPHHLCANCFDGDYKKSILQASVMRHNTYDCPRCMTSIRADSPESSRGGIVPLKSRWDEY